MYSIKFGKKHWPFFILLVLWFLFCSPYFLKGQVPFPSKYLVSFFSPWSTSYGMAVKNNAMPDVITQIYPWKQVTIDSWKNAQIPLWNPYSFSGTGHAANYQTAVWNPMNIVFFLFSFIDAWSIFILLQPLLAGIFTLLFLREIGCSKPSSTIGAIGFMFSGFLVTWMAYGTLGYAALTLPLTLWSIHRFIRTYSWYSYTIGIFAICWSFTAGHFQISLYVYLTSVLYCFVELIKGYKKKRLWLTMSILILPLFIVLPQLYLTYEAFIQSVRASYTSAKEVIPWQYIMTFFSPDIYGNPVTRNDWFGHYAEWAGYVGVIPLVFAFYGGIWSKHPKKMFFLVLGTVTLLLAYQSPLSSLIFFWKIPVLSTSAASRIILITSFSLIVLAAFGIDEITRDWKASRWKRSVGFIVGFLIFLLFIWGIIYGLKPFTTDQLGIAKRNIILPTLLFILFACAMIIGNLKRKWSIGLALFLLIAICCFDSYRYASKWMPFDPKEFVYPEMKILTFLKHISKTERIFGNFGNEVGSSYRIQLIEGYDAMYQSRYGEFISATSDGIVKTPERSVVQFDKNGIYNIPALQLLGVKYIVHRISDGKNIWAFPYWQYGPEYFSSIYRDEHFEVFQFQKAYPRTFLASSYVIRSDKQDIIDTLFGKDMDRRETLVLEEEPDIRPEFGNGNAEIVSYTPLEVVVKTVADVPKLLFLSDTFDSGWHVSVDGIKRPVLRTNYDFRSVALPKGEHMVRFWYPPKGFVISLWISGITCTIILLLLWMIKYNKI